ncbi:hypothetical protein BsWGS_23942 [Bradybaena similaris]
MAIHNRDLEDYWNEFRTIETDHHSDDDELSKTPDEEELDAEWLDAAGFSYVVSKFQDGRDLSDDELETMTDTLTQAQAEAVRKRVSALSTTMRRKNKGSKLHVKDIFAVPGDPQQIIHGEAATLPRPGSSPQSHPQFVRQSSKSTDPRSSTFLHKGVYSMSGVSTETSEDLEAGVTTLGFRPRSRSGFNSDQYVRLSSISDIEVSLDFHLEEAEGKTHHTESHFPDPHRVDLPLFEPKLDPLGVTWIGDLAEADMSRVKALAHIELTALFDEYNIIYSRSKRKKKVKEHGIFTVPLDILMEQDQKKTPGTKVPVVFQAMINFLEKEGLKTEGILRMSGAETRVKQLRQDLEEKFYQGLFSWGDAGPHDVAVLLKQFLRELPVPLFSYSYLDAFPQISSIPKILEQLKALNLLILLLPNEHRNTLKVLLQFLRNVVSHSNYNKMGLKNVAMIMAPNLFLAPSSSNKDKEKVNLELELKKAAETSNIVKMLVHYQDVLWTIPPSFIAQIRYQYALEYHRKNRASKLPWRKDKDRTDIYKKLPGIPDPAKYDRQDGVIRVHAPHLTKSSMLIQLDKNMTAADVVAKFKLGDKSLRADKEKDSHRTIGRVEEANGHTYRNPDNAQYAHDSDYLYEVGGNISERCLDPRTKVLDLHHVNPLADWVIKKREGRPHIQFHSAQ